MGVGKRRVMAEMECIVSDILLVPSPSPSDPESGHLRSGWLVQRLQDQLMRGGSTRNVLIPAFGPTAAADEFHMLDSMFGNMSPIFPFDTTPSDPDPFRLGLGSSDNSNPNTVPPQPHSNSGDPFNWTGNEYVQTAAPGSASSAHGVAGVGGGIKQDLESFAAGQQAQQHGAFDLNSAWAAWTASGGGAGSTGTNVHGVPNGLDTKPILQPTSKPPSSNTNNLRPGSSSSNTLPSAVLQGQAQTQQTPHQGEALRGIGEGPFAMAHPGKEGYRAGRATPSEVYRTVVKP